MFVLKLNIQSRVWNLGDTSFRRKRLLDDYIELLKVLNEFHKKHDKWDKKSQEAFHIMVLQDTTLLDETSVTDELDRRARTMTNALVKLGLCDKTRKLTQVGEYLIKLDSSDTIDYKLDSLEKKLRISNKNIVFLRQLLKFRIFNHTEDKSFNPFLIALLFVVQYDYIPEEHFKKIIQNLYFDQDYVEIIKQYKNVLERNISFEDYINDNLLTVDLETEYLDNKLQSFINKGAGFRDIFTNRKTPESVDLYEDFYNHLVFIRSKLQNGERVLDDDIKKLLALLRNDRVKKAFATNVVFDIPRRSHKDVEFFCKNNMDNPLFRLEDIQFRKKLFTIFNIAKTNDLVNEYYDVTVRTFNLTGILDFSNGRVKISKLYLKELISYYKKELFEELLTFNDYTNMNEYYFDFHNATISSLEILKITPTMLNVFNNDFIKQNNLKTIEELEAYYLELEEKQFVEFINKKFPTKTLISILKNIRDRNDEKVYEAVTDNASVPTIFEYIIGISWYRLSENCKPYRLLQSLNLSLDGSFLPLSHATGGDGDIIINYGDHMLMLEVTLMNLSTQKRGELEPVIRHSTNLATANSDLPTYTIFIANDIDENLSNIFRICSFVNLKSSKTDTYTKNGVRIISLKINEIIYLLNTNIPYIEIYNSMKTEFINDNQVLIENDWREKFVKNISKSKT